MLAGAMQIVAVEPIFVDVPLREPVQGVHGTTAVQRSVLADPARLDAGVIRLPDTPGLGATIDPAALERYRVDL